MFFAIATVYNSHQIQNSKIRQGFQNTANKKSKRVRKRKKTSKKTVNHIKNRYYIMYMLKAVEFANFLDDFQKSKEIQLGSDVVYNMIDYFKTTFEKYNYTLFELIEILIIIKGIRTINCDCNKSAILKMIREEKIDFPFNYHPVQPIDWDFTKGRDYSCITLRGKRHICAAFYKDDIFQTKDGDILTITKIDREDNETYTDWKNVDNVFVYFTKKDFNGIESKISMEGIDFINAFENDDLSIIFCNTLNNDFGIQIGKQKWNTNKRQKIA